jgi:diguanylate cyclase (GGDEF)-like protein/PAS domain S-box-containing protein
MPVLSCQNSQQLFDASFDSAVIGKAVVAITGHCARVNASLSHMLGHAPGALTGVHFADFTHPDDLEADLHLFEAVMRGERDGYQLEKRYIHADGRVLEILLSATCVRDEMGQPSCFISEIVDLTERNQTRRDLQEANDKLRKLVVTDHVTGLWNRRGFDEMLAATPDSESLALLIIDLDHFKRVNDRLGHSAGDIVLKEVARRLPAQVRATDLVARVGGDEFGILLPGGGGSLATEIAERVVHCLADTFEVKGLATRVGASVGVSFSLPWSDRSALLRDADVALYAAKRAGRGQWRLAA